MQARPVAYRVPLPQRFPLAYAASSPGINRRHTIVDRHCGLA